MTPTERDDERTLALQQVSLFAQLSREKTLPKPDASRIARLETASADTARKREAQQAALFARLPELQVWRGLAPAATRDDLASLLPDPATVLLEFIVGDDTLLVLVARRSDQGLTVNTLIEPVSRRALADRVARLMLFATMRDAAKWRAAALELVPGLSAVVGGATRATVIPHEVLWRVPFEALPLPADDGYLADATSFVYAPSVTALVRAPSRVPVPGAPGRTVLAGAAPLEASAASRLAQVAPEWVVRTPESAAREIEAIAGQEPDPVTTTVVDSVQATEAAVRERLAAADVIHLAGPFRINSASPLFSSVLLAPESGQRCRARSARGHEPGARRPRRRRLGRRGDDDARRVRRCRDDRMGVGGGRGARARAAAVDGGRGAREQDARRPARQAASRRAAVRGAGAGARRDARRKARALLLGRLDADWQVAPFVPLLPFH